MFGRNRRAAYIVQRNFQICHLRPRARPEGWRRDSGKHEAFGYKDKPFRVPRMKKNVLRERPRYRIVDQAEKSEEWSPHDWTGMIRLTTLNKEII